MRKYITLFFLLACSAASAETIAENLLLLEETKTDIGTAITAKGQSVTGLPFTRYDEAIASISGYATPTPEVYPAGLNEDTATSTPSWYAMLDTGTQSIMGSTYCGNGICLAYAWAAPAIYRSTNYGVTWSVATYTISDLMYSGAYCGGGIVIATGGGAATQALYRSTNYGAAGSWTRQTINSLDTYILCSEYCGSDTVLVGTSGSGEIHRSTDKAATAWVKQKATGKAAVHSLCSLGNGIVLAGTGAASESIFRSIDYGANWTEITTGFNASAVISLAYCGDGRVLAGTNTNGRIYKSDDYGESWSLATDTTETSIYSLAYCEDGLVYAGGGLNGIIFKSLDKGASGTWSQIVDTEEEMVRTMSYIGNSGVICGLGNTTLSDDGIIYRIFGGYPDKEKWNP